MVHNLWRSAHLWLAVVASVFLLLAAISGAVLSLEPLFIRYSNHHHADLDQVTLAQLIPKLKEAHQELIALEVDAHERVMLSTFSMDEDLPGDFYIHPKTGARHADLTRQGRVFAWTTNFHRSLFLKTPGRIFIGITAFLLLLISSTGFALLIKRLGWLRFFHPFIKTDSASYYHSYLGRINVIPLAIIAISGVVLSLHRFSVFPEAKAPQSMVETERQPRSTDQIPIFQQTSLAQVQSLEFPFSEGPEDPYILTTNQGIYEIHQYTGTVLRKTLFPFTRALQSLSFSLHTGAGSYWWGLVLLVASLSMLYFMYSGFIIAYQRISGNFRNRISPDVAEFVVLVGSEHGRTQHIANAFTKALLQQNCSVYKTHLNDIGIFPKMKQLVVFTATYGDGDPPSNAQYFLERLPQFLPQHKVGFAVVGFGSHLYPKFCQYAKNVQESLQKQPVFTAVVDPTYIDNADSESVITWVRSWSVKNNVHLKVNLEHNQPEKQKEIALRVIDKSIACDGSTETFTLTLKSAGKHTIHSGDLLGIIAEPGAAPRQYSVGRDDKGNILLAVRRHEFGLCSNFLFNLDIGYAITASSIPNPAFHIPKRGKVIFIANGTGIAPFLGMIHEQSKATKELLWGVRNKAVYQLISQEIQQATARKKLQNFSIAFSKEPEGEQYVQDILERNPEYYAQQMHAGDVFMLCGSLTMRNGVLAVLETFAQHYHQKPLSYYQNRGQILSDCY